MVVCIQLCCNGSGPPRPAAATSSPQAEPVAFVYETTEREAFDSRSTRGRATVLLFVTTYDLASQVEAQRLDRIIRGHRPRANAAAVVLETRQYAVLAETFRASLGLSYPICLADDQTRRGRGPFGRLTRVPTVVVLDRSGVEVWRKEGLASSREMGQALATASRRGSPVD
jgi:hypothetical protein